MPLFPDDPEARRHAAAQSIRDVGQRPPSSNRKTQSRGNASDVLLSKDHVNDTSGGGGGGRISALRPTNRDPLRSTIKVDGRAVGTLSQKLIADLNLTIGSPFTRELAAAVADAVVYDKAFRKATRALARRAMSSGMIRQKLRTPPRPRKSALGQDGKPGNTRKPREPDPVPPAAVIDQVLARLAELQLLDDRAFGQALIRDLTRAKPAGPMLLKQKLYAKGLDAKLIDELVAEATADPEEQADGATAFARKKLRSMQHLDADVIKRRLYGQLARRGFTPDAIRTALDTVLKENPEDPFD
ncbi:MAG: regulatory protein RecX [Planctomycetota bacterium]